MGKLLLMAKVCIAISWALMMTNSAAEREYFPLPRKLTWHQARTHCKVCYKDLVTLTPENIQAITKRITSDHWIGLRKNFHFSNAVNMSWTRWADGDPLTFQNWYPGWPVFKSSFPRRDCCSCSCTCQATTTPTMTSSTRSPEFTTPGATTSSGGDTTEHGTDISNFTAATDQPVTDVDNSTAATGQTVTDVDNSTTATDQPVTDVDNSTGATDQPVTDVDNSTGATDQPVTDVDNSTGATDQPVTDVDNSTGATDQPVTDVDNSTTATGQTVTDVDNSTATTDQDVTSSSGFTNPWTTNTPVFTTTSRMMTTALPIEAECVRSPMPMPDVPDPDENYIEDSCVAMLSFGPWVEKHCTELLPFICYEDSFSGHANVTSVTTSSAILTWQRGPGDINHYRVEVEGHQDRVEVQTGLTYDLVNLTAGTYYSVQVFPVKCQRDLNSQNVAFYTTPNKVENFRATEVNETCVSLSWNKPAGRVDFYRVEVHGRMIEVKTQGTVVCGLTPGGLYTLTVESVVADKSTWSEASSIMKYTKPGTVSNLRVSNNTNDSLLLNWDPPVGNTSGFWLTAVNKKNVPLFEGEVNQTEEEITDLPVGTEITVSVTALINDTLKGDAVTIVGYTVPGPISNLTLVATENSISATWIPPKGSCSSFVVELELDGKIIRKLDNLTEPSGLLDGLKTAVNYTVIVCAVCGNVSGTPVERSIFTLPVPPGNASVTYYDERKITFSWDAPVNAERVIYFINISSSFWGHSWNATFMNRNSYTFENLTPGTRYEFEVRTLADESSSAPSKVSQFTVARKREITVSMLCSSAQILLCDKNTTRKSVFDELDAHFQKVFKNDIFWELQEQQSDN